MRVAAVGEAGERAVLEAEQARIRAFGGPRRIPCARERSHGRDPAAAEQPDDVDLVGGLVEHGAAALGGVELLGPARPVEEVGEVQRSDHPHAPELAALDQRARPADRGIEAVAVPDDEMRPGSLRRRDHVAAFVEAERHRLLDQDVLPERQADARPARRGTGAASRCKLRRCRSGTALRRRGKCGRRNPARTAGARPGAGRSRDATSMRGSPERRDHHRERASQPDDAQPEPLHRG